MSSTRVSALAILAALAVVAPAAAQISPADATDRKLAGMYVRNGIAELGLNDRTPEGRRRIAQLEHAVHADLRDRAIVVAEARRRGLAIAQHLPERKRQWIARFGGEAAYRAYLAEHRLTEPEFQRVIEQEIAGELLRDALTREIRVTEEEIRTFYERGRSEGSMAALFVEPEKVTASHILIAARPGLHPDMAERRARAERLRRDLLAGADFATLARGHSDDPATRERGGALGPFTRDTHTERFDDAAFALRPGETSEVIQTEYGFHIIRVTARTARRVRTLDELRPAIEAHLRQQKSAAHLRAWLEDRRATADHGRNPDSHVGR